MSNSVRRDERGRDGFTRGELLIVVLTIGLILLSLIPVVRWQLLRARLTMTIANGKQIYVALFALEYEEPWRPTNRPSLSWPTSEQAAGGAYRNSSDFFSRLVESNVLDVTYPFFATPGSGIRPARDRAEFLDGELHNEWCITLDVNDRLTTGSPCLFTQNIKFRERGPDATLDQMIGLESRSRPFGDRAAVLFQRGGAGFWLSGDSLSLTNFNSPGATNGFLWPLASGQDVSD